MADVLVQFHATIEELTAFVRAGMEKAPVHMTALRFSPFRATLVGTDALDTTLHDPSVREIAFTLESPNTAAGSTSEFLTFHPSAMRLDIGRLSDRGLAESCLSARTDSKEALEAWRKIARVLKSATEAGVIAVNPSTGAETVMKGHRLTTGAKALYREGAALRPVAGTATLRPQASTKP